jgi:hypothetical protein
MIIYKSRFLARAEVWFDEEATENAGIDWILYRQRSGPVRAAKSRVFYDRLVDLSKSEKELAAELSEETAYKIRRARDRDGIICEWHDVRDLAVMHDFEQMHRVFSVQKGLPGLNRPRLESLAAAGALDLSSAKDAQGNTLVYHAYYRDCRRASQLESPSVYRTFSDSATRNFCGRANRYLTWSNILRYKAQGLTSFDFGGWYLGNDPELLNINEFKRSFGGSVTREYQCEQIMTLKGRVVMGVVKLLGRAKARRSGRRRPLQTPKVNSRALKGFSVATE